MYIIIILRIDSGTSEKRVIFADLVQKALVEQNDITDAHMYKCMERVLKCDTKAKFIQQPNLVGSCTVGSFNLGMTTTTVFIFHIHAY